MLFSVKSYIALGDDKVIPRRPFLRLRLSGREFEQMRRGAARRGSPTVRADENSFERNLGENNVVSLMGRPFPVRDL